MCKVKRCLRSMRRPLTEQGIAFKNVPGQASLYRPVVVASCEAKAGGPQVQGSSEFKARLGSLETPSQTKKYKDGGH